MAGGGGEVEPKLSEVAEESPGLLPPDPALWAHLSHAHSHIRPLSPTKSQVTELARYPPMHTHTHTHMHTWLTLPLQVCL